LPNIKESKPAAATRAQLLQRTKELGLDFLDHENTLWMFCLAGKVFDFGDVGTTISLTSTEKGEVNLCGKLLKTRIHSR
jgi:hypothetical protein